MDREYDELIVVGEDENLYDDLKIEYPLYKNCYCEALGAILKNIDLVETDAGRAAEKKKKEGRDSCLLQSKENGYLYMLHSNIIAFIGKRGSGKTTAVNEFCRILSGYHINREKWDRHLTYKKSGGKYCRFYVMPPIDASVLEAKEDLVELILANMYQIFEHEFRKQTGISGGDELCQELIREFTEVYKNYNNVGHREYQEVLGESVLVKLKNVSSSLKTREAFEMLVKNFLRLVEKRGGEYETCGTESYLVITIDDLDLNINKGYDMLEQLHKYLLDRRVVVLIAVDYGQLHLISENYFVRELINDIPCGGYDIIETSVKKAKKLNDDYLLKVLPASNRIYLSGGDILFKGAKVKESTECQTGGWQEIKPYIMGKIAEKTMIFYDICGVKKHFCLPDTVRELTSYNYFLNSLFTMEEIERPSADDEKTGRGRRIVLYDQNHDRFNWDITERMALKILDDEQMRFFRLIIERHIERRAEYAVGFMRSWVQNRKTGKKKKRLPDTVDGMEYQYGDLLKEIYDIGRVDYHDKVLAHCILASFTSEMVREYYSYCNNKDDAARKRASNRLKKFLGCSFGCKWMEEWLPKVEMNQKDLQRFGYIEKGSISNVVFVERYPYHGGMESILELINKMTDFVPYFECISLLFFNLEDAERKRETLDWLFDIKEGETEEGHYIEVMVTNDLLRADFDIFGFIGKEINSESKDCIEYRKNLCANMRNAIENYLKKSKIEKSEWETVEKRLKEEVKKKSMWNGVNKEAIYFPFYNLDMSYNIMKRVLMKTKKDANIGLDNICGYFRKVYGYVVKELKEEDDKYGKINMPFVKKIHLSEDFKQNPFIKHFGWRCEKDGSRKAKEELDEKILNHFLKTIITNLSPGFSMKDQDMQMQ